MPPAWACRPGGVGRIAGPYGVSHTGASNKPVRVFIAVSWGQLFAGVYQVLQGATLDRIDRITRIALSTDNLADWHTAQQPLGTQAALAALVSHRAGFAKVTTPPPEYADA